MATAKISLRVAREQQGLTQRQLAQMAGVAPGTLCRLEYDITVPLAPTRKRIADALGLDVTEIAWGSGEYTIAGTPRRKGPWRTLAAQRALAQGAE